MKSNRLSISIKKPLHEIFSFTITPPNSKLWIPGIINEETNELPVKKETIYTMHKNSGSSFKIIVAEFKQNNMIEFISPDHNYHCRYTYKSITNNTCELTYFEWVDRGELEEPFVHDALEKLKDVLEKL